MKKFFLVFTVAILAAVGFMAAAVPTSADTSGEASAIVYATVNPNVSMSTLTPSVFAGTVQTGQFTATILFRVDANCQFVDLCLEASDLYKAGIVDGAETPPIPLVLNQGGVITPAMAKVVEGSGQDNIVDFSSGAGTFDGFPMYASECVTFESKQIGHFSQDVTVQVKWNQNDPEKPQGQYSGRVKLVAQLNESSPYPQ